MTRDETINILMSIQAAYPNFRVPDKTIAINTWCSMLEEYTYPQVSVALKAYILSDTSGFAPNIGKIIEHLHNIFSQEDSLNEMAAWGLVQKALKNSAYHSEEEFDKLPLLIQKTISSPKQLKEWATMEDLDGTGLNVMQSNFMRTYRAQVEKEKQLNKLGTKLKKLTNKESEIKQIDFEWRTEK